MKRKAHNFRNRCIVLGLVTTLAGGIGVSYAYWSESTTITGTIRYVAPKEEEEIEIIETLKLRADEGNDHTNNIPMTIRVNNSHEDKITLTGAYVEWLEYSYHQDKSDGTFGVISERLYKSDFKITTKGKPEIDKGGNEQLELRINENTIWDGSAIGGSKNRDRICIDIQGKMRIRIDYTCGEKTDHFYKTFNVKWHRNGKLYDTYAGICQHYPTDQPLGIDQEALRAGVFLSITPGEEPTETAPIDGANDVSKTKITPSQTEAPQAENNQESPTSGENEPTQTGTTSEESKAPPTENNQESPTSGENEPTQTGTTSEESKAPQIETPTSEEDKSLQTGITPEESKAPQTETPTSGENEPPPIGTTPEESKTPQIETPTSEEDKSPQTGTTPEESKAPPTENN